MARKSLLAVAVEYSDEMLAPSVSVVGREERARRILRTALRYGIPILERGELAKDLEQNGESRAIDQKNYQAVADAFLEVEFLGCQEKSRLRESSVPPTDLIPRTYLRKSNFD